MAVGQDRGLLMTRMNKSSCRRLIVILWALICGNVAAAQSDLAEDWDVVVVGGGLMGSSTAWHLARAGQRVLLLEKQGAVYTEGSSFGDARISRSLGPPGDIWSYMHNRTVSEMKELIAVLNEHGDSLDMDAVYTTSPVNYVRHKSQLNRVDYLPLQADRYEIATTPKEAVERFGVSMPIDAYMVREYKDHSGTINPAAVIKLLHRGIETLGGHVAYGQRVMRLTRAGDAYELGVSDLESGSMETLIVPKVVSAAGPYTGSLLIDVAPEFDRLVTPKRVYLAFFEVTPQFWDGLSPSEQLGLRNLFPAINSTVPGRATGSFSMVERFTPRGTPILKIGGHFQRTDISDLDAVWQEELSEDEEQWARDRLLHHLSLLGVGMGDEHLQLDVGYSCVYSLTGSEVPYVTFAPGVDGAPDPNLVVIAGLSGVGAKGSLAYGVIATDLLLGRTETDPVYLAAREAFGFERLQKDITGNSSN
jgi:glycine/D-amino acid oxidase-like deaminating enzyme